MLKKSAGNMYDWVTHTHSHLGGECPHKCSYCYVKRNRFGVAPRYQGELRILPDELMVNYGTGKTIFIEHMNDLFADGVTNTMIANILSHCRLYPGNKYVFQTKNPERAIHFLNAGLNFMLGTTIESNRSYPELSASPSPLTRAVGLLRFHNFCDTFVTIEPIMDFDVSILVDWLKQLQPTFINIGADSKGCNLPEPPPEKVKEFIIKLGEAGIVIRKKVNLGRMLL